MRRSPSSSKGRVRFDFHAGRRFTGLGTLLRRCHSPSMCQSKPIIFSEATNITTKQTTNNGHQPRGTPCFGSGKPDFPFDIRAELSIQDKRTVNWEFADIGQSNVRRLIVRAALCTHGHPDIPMRGTAILNSSLRFKIHHLWLSHNPARAVAMQRRFITLQKPSPARLSMCADSKAASARATPWTGRSNDTLAMRTPGKQIRFLFPLRNQRIP